jgi:transmembrane sensor
MNAASAPVSAKVLDAAIAWQLRLDGTLNGPEREALTRWLAANEEHARAWQQLGMLDQRFSAATGPARKALLQSREGTRRRVRSLGGGIAGVVAVLAIALLAHDRYAPLGYWLADQRTATGEQKVVRLDDGTVINLNTHSAIDVRYSAQQRLIVLREGEILVETGHKDNDQRPFLVETEDGRLRALGTRFVVRREAQGTRLGVLKSAVAARPEGGSAERILKEGEQVLMHRNGLDTTLAMSPGADAWTRGMLVVDNVRLGDLVGELSRYRAGHMGVSDSVADLRITGSFPIKDTDLALKAVTTTLPVQVEQRTPWWVTVAPGGKG